MYVKRRPTTAILWYQLHKDIFWGCSFLVHRGVVTTISPPPSLFTSSCSIGKFVGCSVILFLFLFYGFVFVAVFKLSCSIGMIDKFVYFVFPLLPSLFLVHSSFYYLSIMWFILLFPTLSWHTLFLSSCFYDLSILVQGWIQDYFPPRCLTR